MALDQRQPLLLQWLCSWDQLQPFPRAWEAELQACRKSGVYAGTVCNDVLQPQPKQRLT